MPATFEFRTSGSVIASILFAFDFHLHLFCILFDFFGFHPFIQVGSRELTGRPDPSDAGPVGLAPRGAGRSDAVGEARRGQRLSPRSVAGEGRTPSGVWRRSRPLSTFDTGSSGL